MSKLQIYEILSKLKEFTGEGSVTKKIEWLKQNDSQTLRLLLQHNFDPNIQYDLPEGDPPFKMNEKPIDYTESNLYAETRKLAYLWVAPYDASLKTRVEAQQLEIAKQEQFLSDFSTQQKAIETEFHAAQKAYENASREHDTNLTILADLEAKITLAKKNIDASRVTMAQLKVQMNTLGARRQDVQGRVAQINATLQRMNGIHETDKKRLAKQPAAAPSVENLPSTKDMPRHRLENAFIQMLESLHPNEARIVLAVKNKTLGKMFSLNKDIVKKAFPDILK